MIVQLLAMTSTNPDAESALNKYLSVVGPPLMELAGAKAISRFELSDKIVGANEFHFVTLIERPDEASVGRALDSKEYKSLEEVKKLAFSKYQVNAIVST